MICVTRDDLLLASVLNDFLQVADCLLHFTFKLLFQTLCLLLFASN